MTRTPIDTDNPEFQNALRLIQYTRQSVFLTGKAGTGNGKQRAGTRRIAGGDFGRIG